MPFDFEAAVQAPFRMQPGLRRLRDDDRAAGFTPARPGARHQREKLAVLSAYPALALQRAQGFGADEEAAMLRAVGAAAQTAVPQAWRLLDDGGMAAPALGVALDARGEVRQQQAGVFGLGDEIARCLLGLPPAQRPAALLSLAFEEDYALLDGRPGDGFGQVPWMAVALPSRWAPAEKVGRAFAAIHAPVADNALLQRAAPQLVALATGGERWERFVWTVTDHPRLNAHPDLVPAQAWPGGAVEPAWWRSEHQTLQPLPGTRMALFTIHVQVEPLAAVLARAPGRAGALHDAIASMSDAVLDYRGLGAVRGPLLAWLAARAGAES